MKKRRQILAAAGTLCLLSTVALAQDVGQETAAEPEPQFVLDPSTRAMLDHSQRYVTADAKGNLRLVDGHRHVLLARVSADGEVEMYCADNVHSAEKWAAAKTETEQKP